MRPLVTKQSRTPGAAAQAEGPDAPATEQRTRGLIENPDQDVQEPAGEDLPERLQYWPIERKDPIHDLVACLHKELGDPLAVISITSHNLRRNLEAGDSNMAAALYCIERSVHRCARIMWEFSGGPVSSRVPPAPTSLDACLDGALSE